MQLRATADCQRSWHFSSRRALIAADPLPSISALPLGLDCLLTSPHSWICCKGSRPMPMTTQLRCFRWLSLICTLSAAAVPGSALAGPPFQTDDPEPVDLGNYGSTFSPPVMAPHGRPIRWARPSSLIGARCQIPSCMPSSASAPLSPPIRKMRPAAGRPVPTGCSTPRLE